MSEESLHRINQILYYSKRTSHVEEFFEKMLLSKSSIEFDFYIDTFFPKSSLVLTLNGQ